MQSCGIAGDCIICYSDVAEEEAAVMPCRHPICQTCMDMHMRTRVEQGNVEVVECPEEGCRALIPREVCERYLPAHLIQQCDAAAGRRQAGSTAVSAPTH